MERVVIVGSGNLAEALACALVRSGRAPVQVFGRNARRVRAVVERLHALDPGAATAGATHPEELCREADLYLLAVSDGAVGEVAAALPIPATAAVAHTAGSVELEALPARFERRGVFYPMQTFTAGRAVDFGPIPIFVEASTPELLAELEALARRLTRTVLRADGAQRRKVHLAAVFVSNFANALYGLGERIVRSAGLEFEVLKPLIAETAAKACDAASPAEVQTGPAVRGDAATMERHRALLADDPLLDEIYSTLSRSIWETSRKT